MKSIAEIAKERLVYYERFDLQKSKPELTIHRFSVYKLRIIKRLYSSDYGELNFLIQDDQNPAEKCIVYAILWKPNIIHEIKYWRAIEMDKELAGYIVKAFILGHLFKKYILKCTV
jgi:hypothetical protein